MVFNCDGDDDGSNDDDDNDQFIGLMTTSINSKDLDDGSGNRKYGPHEDDDDETL
jgi:hypothetical protein